MIFDTGYICIHSKAELAFLFMMIVFKQADGNVQQLL